MSVFWGLWASPCLLMGQGQEAEFEGNIIFLSFFLLFYGILIHVVQTKTRSTSEGN